MNEFDLSAIFARCGEIKSSKLIKSAENDSFYGFVIFSTRHAQDIALNLCQGIKVRGQSILIKRAYNKYSRQKTTFPVFVGSIPKDTTEEELKNCFSFFGFVASVKIFATEWPKTCGFVNFTEQISQEEALRTGWIDFFDTYLQISPSRSQSNKIELMQRDPLELQYAPPNFNF